MGVITGHYNQRADDIAAASLAVELGRVYLQDAAAEFEALGEAYKAAGLPVRIRLVENDINFPTAPFFAVMVSGLPTDKGEQRTRPSLIFGLGARGVAKDVSEGRREYAPMYNVVFNALAPHSDNLGTGSNDFTDNSKAVAGHMKAFVGQIETALGGLTDAQITAVSAALKERELAAQSVELTEKLTRDVAVAESAVQASRSRMGGLISGQTR